MWDIEELSKKYTPFQMQKLHTHQPTIVGCALCGTLFDSTSYHFRPTAIYRYTKVTCSPACTKKYAGGKNKRIFSDYTCVGCKQTFVPHPKKPRQTYCNKKCRGLVLRGTKRPEHATWAHKLKPPRNSISDSGTKWLSQFPITHREYVLRVGDRVVRVDGFNEQTNTVYEYLGSFWHGNPLVYDPAGINPVNKRSFGDLYETTISRLETIRAHGYTVVFQWSLR